MADNLPDNKKPYQLPQPFEYEQPDLPSSTANASEEAFEQQKQQKETKQQEEQEKQADSDLSPEQQNELSPRFNQEKQERKVSAQEEGAAKLAATAATSAPGIGWFIKAVAIIIRILKFFTGEKIASFLAVWFLISAAFAFLNILPIVGTILFIIIPPCAALVVTPLIWPKIKPFLEEAGKITPTKK